MPGWNCMPGCLERNHKISPIDAFYENTHTHTHTHTQNVQWSFVKTKCMSTVACKIPKIPIKATVEVHGWTCKQVCVCVYVCMYVCMCSCVCVCVCSREKYRRLVASIPPPPHSLERIYATERNALYANYIFSEGEFVFGCSWILPGTLRLKVKTTASCFDTIPLQASLTSRRDSIGKFPFFNC